MIQADPTGRFVLVNDLGLDQIFVWKFDVQEGTLTANDPPAVLLPPGAGPRHFVFAANGRRVYSVQEKNSTLVVFDFDPASGRLTAKQTISTVPEGFTGSSFPSEVMVSADERFVYVANRLHDSLASFSIGEGGVLTWLGEDWARGEFPRHANIDPTGNFLYSCNQKTDGIAAFRINRETGKLTFTGQYTPVGAPASIIFLS
jgi:6-phosphogluconolactonase (cycloisomerase 2 family)